MPDIKFVTIVKINTGIAMLSKYKVDYTSGVSRTYGIPLDNVEKFIKANRIEFAKVKYTFYDESEVNNDKR